MVRHGAFRLDPSQKYTCDQTHRYTPEQQAFDAGLMDKFPPNLREVACAEGTYPSLAPYGTGVVMGYYDGNTVTRALELRTIFFTGRQFSRLHVWAFVVIEERSISLLE